MLVTLVPFANFTSELRLLIYGDIVKEKPNILPRGTPEEIGLVRKEFRLVEPYCKRRAKYEFNCKACP